MKIYLTFLFSVLLGLATAQAQFQVPELQGPVMDQAGYLSPEHRAVLTRLLSDLNQRGVAQIQVLVVPSLQGESIEQASIDTVEKWKLGDAQKDNGILFLVAADDRKLRIEVGQGLEGAIPDAYASRIIRDTVVPYFRQRQFSEGILQGTYQIIALADKEFGNQQGIVAEEPAKKRSLPTGIILFLLFIIITLGRFGGGRGRHIRGGLGGFGAGLGAGGWGSSGGGGGGWSGGGGGFSGGGSSGSW